MKEKITGIADLGYFQLAMVFIILVALNSLNIVSPSIDYKIFGYVLVALSIPALIFTRRSEPGELNRGVLPVLLAAFAFAFVVRMMPYFDSPVPPGYDPGFYKYTLEFYADALPQIPERELATWVKEMYPQGVFVFSDGMHVVADIGSLQVIKYLFVFLGAFLVFPVYMVAGSLFGRRAGLLAAVLYAVSYTQFEVYNLCYLKNIAGLMFLLFSIYALEKERYGLMAVSFAALGIFHRPEFLLFALILVPYFILYRKKGILLGALGAALLILPFWIPRLEQNLPMLSDVMGGAYSSIQGGEGATGGHFLPFSAYHDVSVVYFPFALIGGIYLAVRRKWNSVFFYFLINLSIVVFQLIFYRRFIIPLDIVMVILAAVGIEYTILRRGWVPRAGMAVILAVIVLAAGSITFDWARDTRPFISQDRLEAVEWIRDNSEADDYVLATSFDAPWALGWSERRVIAPGLFEWSKHGKQRWWEFMVTDDPQVAKDFMNEYEGTIYIYSSQTIDDFLNLEKFESSDFDEVYSRGAVIYRYPGGS